jgi:hypothetical protein
VLTALANKPREKKGGEKYDSFPQPRLNKKQVSLSLSFSRELGSSTKSSYFFSELTVLVLLIIYIFEQSLIETSVFLLKIE